MKIFEEMYNYKEMDKEELQKALDNFKTLYTGTEKLHDVINLVQIKYIELELKDRYYKKRDNYVLDDYLNEIIKIEEWLNEKPPFDLTDQDIKHICKFIADFGYHIKKQGGTMKDTVRILTTESEFQNSCKKYDAMKQLEYLMKHSRVTINDRYIKTIDDITDMYEEVYGR